MKKRISDHIISFCCLFLSVGAYAASARESKPQLLIRLDDCGMNHSVNMAIEEVAKTGIPFSTSVMFCCPWYQEAVAMLKKYPHISVGVHLTLNAEWRYYRWGPILGGAVVPSLVDEYGYFLPSIDAVVASCRLDEVEKELSAQIDRALSSGLKIDYIDYHMETAVATLKMRAIVEKLSKKYHLGISWYFGEEKYKTTSTKTKDDIYKHLTNLRTDKVNLVVFHIAEADPEMDAIVSMNKPEQGESVMAGRRSVLLKLLVADDFKQLVNQRKFDVITYRDLVKTAGLENMHPPALNQRQTERANK